MKKKYESEHKKINTKFLCVDPLYQRKTDMARVRRMAKNYNECLVNDIKVSFRDGKYWIFDGAHTAELQKFVNKGNDLPVDCKVFYGLTWLDECLLFLAQTGDSRAVKMNDKFRTMHNAGDPDVCRMIDLAEKVGFTVDFTGRKENNKIVALTTLAALYKAMDEADYVELLSLIKETWDGVSESLNSEMLKGMYIFYTTYKGQFNRKTFVKKLGSVSPGTVLREGKASQSPGFGKYARQILGFYNSGLRNRLPDML